MNQASAQIAACVRACAMKPLLLKGPDWRALYDADQVVDVLIGLGRRGLDADHDMTVLAAERHAHDAVIGDARKLARFVDGTTRELLLFFVYYYDLLNIHARIRQLHAGAGEPHEVSVLYDTGRLGCVDAGELASVTNVAALASLVKGTVLANPVESGLLRYREEGSVARLIEATDFGFFQKWIGVAQRQGFGVHNGTDGSGLGVYLAAQVVQAVVRLHACRGHESAAILNWLSLLGVAGSGRDVLSLLNEPDAGTRLRRLAARFLPATGGELAAAPNALQALVARHAARDIRGVDFTPRFLTGYLLMRSCQARELTVLLEAKAAALDAGGCSVFGQVQA